MSHEQSPKKPVLTRGHIVGGGVVGALLALQPLINMFSTREATDAKFLAIQNTVTSVDKKIDDNQRAVMERFDRLASSLRERDIASEQRHERDVDRLTSRVETLEASRMNSWPKAKTNN